MQAYNDFLTDWCSVAPDRLIAITALPFWDVELAVAELHRCVANGHRAVNFCNQPQDYGQPPLAHPHWDPIWAAAQEAGVSVSFHVGGGSMGTQFDDAAEMGWMTNFAKVSSLIFLDNIRCVADLIFGGVCHRFPDLKFVSVESGVGWIPGTLETCDWQWRNGGVLDEHPEYDLLPSEYFRRQIYGCFWFEERRRVDAIGRFPDNILFETDYPHPTCQHPGPRTPAQRPRDYASRVLGDLADDVLAKVLHDNAAARVRTRMSEPELDLAVPDLGSPIPPRRAARPGAAPADRPPRTTQRVHPGHVPRPSSGPRSGRTSNPSSTRCASPGPTSGSARAATWRATPTTPRDSRSSGTPTDQFPFRHIERCSKLWIARDQRPVPSPVGSC